MMRDSYDAVAELIDPQFIVSNLRERYGPKLDAPDFHPDDRMPIALRIANQFAYLHKAATESTAQSGEAPST